MEIACTAYTPLLERMLDIAVIVIGGAGAIGLAGVVFMLLTKDGGDDGVGYRSTDRNANRPRSPRW